MRDGRWEMRDERWEMRDERWEKRDVGDGKKGMPLSPRSRRRFRQGSRLSHPRQMQGVHRNDDGHLRKTPQPVQSCTGGASDGVCGSILTGATDAGSGICLGSPPSHPKARCHRDPAQSIQAALDVRRIQVLQSRTPILEGGDLNHGTGRGCILSRRFLETLHLCMPLPAPMPVRTARIQESP